MNAFGSMSHQEVLRVKLEVLRREHRDLDNAIAALQDAAAGANHLTLRRLKKQKLGLKDQIAQIEDELLPDIIA
ncbi:MAG: YdcH family protein [Qingshengfaniella sp.]